MNFRYMQYFSASAASILLASTAMYVAWYRASQVNLVLGTTPLGEITNYYALYWSLILGTAVGAVLSGFIVDNLGRKINLLGSAVLLFVPWIITAFAKSMTLLVVGRLIAGIGSSLAVVTAVAYNGEIAENGNRGKLGLIYSIAIAFGNIFVQGLAPSVSYTNLALICSAFPLIFALLLFFMPESPYYLVKIGQRDAAHKNLLRLSKGNDNQILIKNRFEEIEESVSNDIQNKARLKRYTVKSLIVMIGITTIQAFSGSILWDNLGFLVIASNSITMTYTVGHIIYGSLQIISYLIAGILVDRIGRKPLLIMSVFGCAVMLIAEAVYIFSEHHMEGVRVEVVTALVVIHVLLNAIGICSLPYVLMGELFPVNNKGVAIAVITFYHVALNFFALYLVSFAFVCMSAIICILGGGSIAISLRETKNKSFIEIRP